MTVFEKSSFCGTFCFWDKWHCLVVWLYCLGAPFFWIGQTKRSKWQKFSKLIRQKEATKFSSLLFSMVVFNLCLFHIDCRNKKPVWWTEASINKYAGCQSDWFFVCSSFAFFITVANCHCIFEWCFWLEVSHVILGFHCIASWNKHCIAIKITALKISLWEHNKI